MMINRISGEQRVNIIAIAVSVLLHLVLFVQPSSSAVGSQAQAPNYATRISLNLMPPATQPPQLVKMEPPAEPVRKPKAESKPRPQKKPVLTETVAPVVPELAAATHVEQQMQHGQNNVATRIRKNYLNNLLIHIEGHKYYPQSARSRNIKGNIEVSFELLHNGEISELKTSGGPMILRKAAEQSIAKALPLPAPPAEVSCPLQVSYVMQFELSND